MQALIDFVHARLTEEEQRARAASEHQVHLERWGWEDKGRGMTLRTVHASAAPQVLLRTIETPPWSVMHYLLYHDPARALADVRAKRKIVEAYAHTLWLESRGHVTDFATGQQHALRTAVGALATAWADHEDFDEDWS